MPRASAEPRVSATAPTPLIGGVLEDDTVAYTHALHDALSSTQAHDPETTRRLGVWRTEVLALLRDVAPGREDQVYRALLSGHEISGRQALCAAVEQILSDNIDVVRAGG
jgi:hypothetical protein